MRSLSEIEPYQKAMTFRDTLAWSAIVRNTNTGETRHVVALAQCFNEAMDLEGVTVTERPQHQDDFLVGSTATITEVIGRDLDLTVTLRHPYLGTFELFMTEELETNHQAV